MFFWSRLVSSIILLLLTAAEIIPQDTPSQTEFPIGAFISENPATYGKIDSSGINYMMGGFTEFTQNSPIKLMGCKANTPDAYISKYAMGYYTKWEAERDAFGLFETGIKHPHNSVGYIKGKAEDYRGAECWASDSSTGETINNLIWGPNYRQDKKYRWYLYPGQLIPYITEYRVAFTHSEQFSDTTSICRLSVYYHYKWKVTDSDTGSASVILADSILRSSDFPADTFYKFTLQYNYPDSLVKDFPRDLPGLQNPNADTLIIDTDPLTGIEFRIDFFGKGKLYTDWVQVYDQNIWGDYISNPGIVTNLIKTFSNNHSSWNSLEYWFAYEEPNTLDSYTPFRLVDSLLQHNSEITKHKPLATIIYPAWNGQVNGDWHLKKFVELANPSTLMIDRFTIWQDYTVDEGLKWLKYSLQEAALAKPDFWFTAQAFGSRMDDSTGDYCYWRKPTPNELNASVMLALAHGSKGIMLWEFSSSPSVSVEVNCANHYVYYDAILKENVMQPLFIITSGIILHRD